MQPPRGRLGTRAVLGGHGTQLKKGEAILKTTTSEQQNPGIQVSKGERPWNVGPIGHTGN